MEKKEGWGGGRNEEVNIGQASRGMIYASETPGVVSGCGEII